MTLNPWDYQGAHRVTITAGQYKGETGVVVNHMPKTYGVRLDSTARLVRVKRSSTKDQP